MAEMHNTPLWIERLLTDHQVVAYAEPRTRTVDLFAGGHEAIDAATTFIQEYVSAQTMEVEHTFILEAGNQRRLSLHNPGRIMWFRHKGRWHI